MRIAFSRILRWRLLALVVWLLLPVGTLLAEKVADLAIPTAYVNDYAQVLSPGVRQQIEDLARAVHNQANADLFVVTIKTLDDGQSVEEFTEQLIEKWKIGKKGEDRSTLLVLVLNPRKLRIETGYGLEGILNDAKVGNIRDLMKPYASQGNYDQAVLTGEQGLANVVAADAHVTLTPVTHTYHRENEPQKLQISGTARLLLGIGGVVLLFILIKTGNLGWALYLLSSLAGGGGGGGGRGRDDDGGGGFGGIGGGSSGGGGASGDY